MKKNIEKNIRIEALEAEGFKRWTKGNHDRLYISAKDLGLNCTYYKTGNIASAEWDGEKISNRQASILMNSKTYIDLNDNTINTTENRLLWAVEDIIERVC